MENWFDRKRVLILTLVLALIGAGTYFYQSILEKKEEEARSALYKVQKVFEEERNAIPEAERSAGASLDVDAKFSKTVAELGGLLQSKTLADQGIFEAAYRLGSLYLEYRQPDKAAKVLSQGTAHARSQIQKASIQLLLGSAFEESGSFGDSLAAFQAGLAQKVAAMKPDFLLGIMRVHLQKKELDQAKKVLDQISKDLPGSKALETANQMLKESK